MSEEPKDKVLQLKVHLESVSPMIWRRIHVLEDTTIAHLHGILQVAMGWANTNLHTFKIFNESYGISYSGGGGFGDNPEAVRLSNFKFRSNDKFYYEYNFFGGRPWTHQVRVEKILPANPKKSYPLCTDGKLSCPPDALDTAQEYIYARELFDFPTRNLYEIMRFWEMIGYCWSPEIFNKSVINLELQNEEIRCMPQKDRLFPDLKEGYFQEEYWEQDARIKVIQELYELFLDSEMDFNDEYEDNRDLFFQLLARFLSQKAAYATN